MIENIEAATDILAQKCIFAIAVTVVVDIVIQNRVYILHDKQEIEDHMTILATIVFIASSLAMYLVKNT